MTDEEARICELAYGFTEYEPVPTRRSATAWASRRRPCSASVRRRLASHARPLAWLSRRRTDMDTITFLHPGDPRPHDGRRRRHPRSRPASSSSSAPTTGSRVWGSSRVMCGERAPPREHPARPLPRLGASRPTSPRSSACASQLSRRPTRSPLPTRRAPCIRTTTCGGSRSRRARLPSGATVAARRTCRLAPTRTHTPPALHLARVPHRPERPPPTVIVVHTKPRCVQCDAVEALPRPPRPGVRRGPAHPRLDRRLPGRRHPRAPVVELPGEEPFGGFRAPLLDAWRVKNGGK